MSGKLTPAATRFLSSGDFQLPGPVDGDAFKKEEGPTREGRPFNAQENAGGYAFLICNLLNPINPSYSPSRRISVVFCATSARVLLHLFQHPDQTGKLRVGWLDLFGRP